MKRVFFLFDGDEEEAESEMTPGPETIQAQRATREAVAKGVSCLVAYWAAQRNLERSRTGRRSR